MDVTLEFLEASARKTSGVTDAPDRYEAWTEYELPDGRRYRRVGGFAKGNPFEVPSTGLVSTTEGLVPEPDLVKTTGVVDDDNEYTCWVEYRRPGNDAIVHRSADVKLKRPPAAGVSGVGVLR